MGYVLGVEVVSAYSIPLTTERAITAVKNCFMICMFNDANVHTSPLLNNKQYMKMNLLLFYAISTIHLIFNTL
jgi:hypothetical protein